MAPRKTQNGASAATRRTPTRGGVRTSPASRSRASAASASKPARKKPRTSSAKKSVRRAAGFDRWWTIPAAVVVALAVFAWTYYPVVRVQYRETREHARLSVELQNLKERNQRLRTQVERLKTPEGVEDYARSQLGLVKKGEHRVVVVDQGASTQPPAQPAVLRIDSDETTAAPVGPWTAFLDLVFGVE